MTTKEKLIAIVDNDVIRKSDAIVLLEGDGMNRCSKAIDLYKAGLANVIVFSGAADDHSYGSFPISEIMPILMNEGIPASDIIHENTSLNTREQALEILKLAKKFNWKKLILVASPHHQHRAYLTFLRSIIDTDSKIILYNAPANNLPWFSNNDWGQRFDLLDKEFSKIEKYSKLSHIATADEAIQYQKWKEQQV